MGKTKTETRLQQARRHVTLAAEQQLGHLAECSAQDEGRRREMVGRLSACPSALLNPALRIGNGAQAL